MSLLVRPNLPPSDELDGLLRTFFQAELPDPFPSLEAPAPRAAVLSPRPARSGWNLFRSRLALAASVALLVAGPLFLPHGDRAANPDAITAPDDGGKADRKTKPGMPKEGDLKDDVSLEFDPVTGMTRLKITVDPMGAPGR
jgi:hypothetical protein